MEFMLETGEDKLPICDWYSREQRRMEQNEWAQRDQGIECIYNWIPEAWILSFGLHGIANVGAPLKWMIHGLCVTDRTPRAIFYWCGGGNATDKMVRECDEMRSFLHILLWTFAHSLYENSLEESTTIRGDATAQCLGPGQGGSLSAGTSPPCPNPDLHQELIRWLGAADFFPTGIIVSETKISSFPSVLLCAAAVPCSSWQKGPISKCQTISRAFPVSPEAGSLHCLRNEAFGIAISCWCAKRQLGSIFWLFCAMFLQGCWLLSPQ